MSSDLERLRAEIRQAREEANQSAIWIIVLLGIIAAGGFGAVGAALSGLIIPALIMGLSVLVVGAGIWAVRGLYRGIFDISHSWQNPVSEPARSFAAYVGSRGERLFAIAVALFVLSIPFIPLLLR